MTKRKGKTSKIHFDGKTIKKKRSKKSRTQLSDLPMDILSSIVSRLPLNEAIRTSILSHHWKHVWCNHTNLSFAWSTMMPKDYNPNCPPAVKRHKQQVFIKRVDDVLLQHSGEGVEHISIHFDLNASHMVAVNRWITFAIESKTKELSLELSYRAPEYVLKCKADERIGLYGFPFQLFDTRNGSHLQFRLLTSIPVELPARFEGFVNLKMLYLCDVRITDKDLHHLLSKCSRLEFLGVAYCKNITRVPPPESQLEHLEVANCSSLREIELNNSMTILEYRGRQVSFISSGNICLTNICIKLLHVDTSIKHLFIELPDTLLPSNTPTSSFGGFENSRPVSSRRYPNFLFLRSLILEMDIVAPPKTRPDVLDVAYLMQAAPVMEKLEFHMFVRYGHKPYCPEDKELRSLPPHPHPHLKAVRITGFFGHKDQLELALYVLANSPALESMEVDPTVVLLDPTDEALYLPEDSVFLDGYKIATRFLREADQRHVVEVVSICPSTNILMSLRKRLLLSHRLNKVRMS